MYILHWWIHNFSTLERVVELVWNLMTHGDAREGNWRGNWRMEWVASALTLPRKVVYPALLTLMRTPRLPAIDWNDAPADLSGLVHFGERRNLVSARVPSGFKRAITTYRLIFRRILVWNFSFRTSQRITTWDMTNILSDAVNTKIPYIMHVFPASYPVSKSVIDFGLNFSRDA
jgi:hypothetical protein